MGRRGGGLLGGCAPPRACRCLGGRPDGQVHPLSRVTVVRVRAVRPGEDLHARGAGQHLDQCLGPGCLAREPDLDHAGRELGGPPTGGGAHHRHPRSAGGSLPTTRAAATPWPVPAGGLSAGRARAGSVRQRPGVPLGRDLDDRRGLGHGAAGAGREHRAPDPHAGQHPAGQHGGAAGPGQRPGDHLQHGHQHVHRGADQVPGRAADDGQRDQDGQRGPRSRAVPAVAVLNVHVQAAHHASPPRVRPCSRSTRARYPGVPNGGQSHGACPHSTHRIWLASSWPLA